MELKTYITCAQVVSWFAGFFFPRENQPFPPLYFFRTDDLTVIVLYYVHTKSSFKSTTLWLLKRYVMYACVQFLVQSLTTVEENLDS